MDVSTQNRSENFKDYAEVSGVKPLYTIFQLYHDGTFY